MVLVNKTRVQCIPGADRPRRSPMSMSPFIVRVDTDFVAPAPPSRGGRCRSDVNRCDSAVWNRKYPMLIVNQDLEVHPFDIINYSCFEWRCFQNLRMLKICEIICHFYGFYPIGSGLPLQEA